MSNFHNNSNLLLNNSTHPIIQQKNTFSLDRKLLTIHANDREQFFYNNNVFSIKTPQPYNNVQSLRLTEINFPSKINNFSKNLNNNIFYINSDPSPINIPDGNYTQEQLANFLHNNIHDISVVYLPDRQRFLFYSSNPFSLNFKLNLENCNFINPQNSLKHNTNNPRSNNNIDVFNMNDTLNPSLIINEGFSYDIGFDLVVNQNNPDVIRQSSTNKLPLNQISSILSDDTKYYHIISDSPPRFRDQQPIYMEIDSLNINYDELNPFPTGTNNMFSNQSNSSTRTAFIKIPPFIYNAGGFQYDNLQNGVAFFEAPIKRIQNLKFKFRYHDNKLVDLDNQDVNFTIEINQLRSNMHRDMKIQTPIL